MPDPREPLGRIFHEQGRMTVNAEREKPFYVLPWEGRTAEEKELDMRGASAVAVRAVADAKLRNERLEAQVLALGAHMPAILDALSSAVAGAEYEALAKPYRAALEALGGTGETQERSEDKEAGHG